MNCCSICISGFWRCKCKWVVKLKVRNISARSAFNATVRAPSASTTLRRRHGKRGFVTALERKSATSRGLEKRYLWELGSPLGSQSCIHIVVFKDWISNICHIFFKDNSYPVFDRHYPLLNPVLPFLGTSLTFEGPEGYLSSPPLDRAIFGASVSFEIYHIFALDLYGIYVRAGLRARLFNDE